MHDSNLPGRAAKTDKAQLEPEFQCFDKGDGWGDGHIVNYNLSRVWGRLILGLIPPVMAFLSFLSVVSDFKANAIGVIEKCGPVVSCVVWV